MRPDRLGLGLLLALALGPLLAQGPAVPLPVPAAEAPLPQADPNPAPAATAEQAAEQRAEPPADPAASADRLRTRGPVTVTADRAEWAQDGLMIYTGSVKMSARDLDLEGERLELRQRGAGRFEARLSGDPARLSHAGLPEGEGRSGPRVLARARQLSYDAVSGVVELSGDALLVRGEDEISGQIIRYRVAERRIEANGGSRSGQVRIVIQAPEEPVETADPPASPSPSPSPGPAADGRPPPPADEARAQGTEPAQTEPAATETTPPAAVQPPAAEPVAAGATGIDPPPAPSPDPALDPPPGSSLPEPGA
ncbi:MAG TPA: LptA/OstA family protein [Nevskiaceae bacterium]|nr:LptA/OstA family protein [Nevskiaceae bacterium]